MAISATTWNLWSATGNGVFAETSAVLMNHSGVDHVKRGSVAEALAHRGEVADGLTHTCTRNR